MILGLLLVPIFVFRSISTSFLSPTYFTSSQLHLSQLHAQIKRRTLIRPTIHVKVSRLFQQSIALGDQIVGLENVEVVPSISLPYKDNIYHSVILRRNSNFFSLRGQLLAGKRDSKILVSSSQNEQTYFGQILLNKTVQISRLKVTSKKIEVEKELWLDFSPYQHDQQQMDVFIAINHPTRKCFLLAHRSQGLILFFHHNATIIQYFHTFTSIIQILKVGSNLFVLTLGELFFFSLTKNLNRTSCLIPWDGIEELQLDESNFKFVYGKRGETIYQFEVGEECRPVGQFHILPKSSFFVASQLIFLQSHQINYVINTTSGKASRYSFPFTACNGATKLAVNRKIQSSFMVTQICLGKNQLNLSHLLLELEDSAKQATDFSKFRIPLLFLSFGIIVYVTVKNKNKEKSLQAQKQEKEEDDQEIKHIFVRKDEMKNMLGKEDIKGLLRNQEQGKNKKA